MRIFEKNWKSASAILIFVLCAAIVMSVWAFQNEMQISNGLGVKLSEVSGGLSDDPATYKYRTAYTENGIPSDEGLEKLLIDEYAHCVTEEEEGSVLLRNEGNALPLKSDERKLTLLGEDEIKVSQYGQWILIDGIRRGVARAGYKLDSYIQMTKHD